MIATQTLEAVERDSQPDYTPAHRRRRGDLGFILPKPYPMDGVLKLNLPGAPCGQAEHAASLWAYGLETKAVRQSRCGLVGGRRDCLGCGEKFYVRFWCGNRYCPNCGLRIFSALFAKHVRLRPVVERLVPVWPVRGRRPDLVIAKIDFTQRNTGTMPDAEQVKRFNCYIRKFWRKVEKRFCIRCDQYGVLWCDEFGGKGNTNLHAHGIYAGPWLPQKELSRIWLEVTRDSFVVYIKMARSFEAALAHALKYAGKFLSKDPGRLAQLEIAFHGTRRVHAMAAFYNPGDAEVGAEADVVAIPEAGCCPLCGDDLYRPPGWTWRTIRELEDEGLRDVEEVRRERGRQKIFSGSGPP